MGKRQRDCVGCGASVGIIGRDSCSRCVQRQRHSAAKSACPDCGRQRVLRSDTGRCNRCSRRCSTCRTSRSRGCPRRSTRIPRPLLGSDQGLLSVIFRCVFEGRGRIPEGYDKNAYTQHALVLHREFHNIVHRALGSAARSRDPLIDYAALMSYVRSRSICECRTSQPGPGGRVAFPRRQR